MPPMSSPESRATATGFAIMLLSVSAGIHSSAGGFGLLLGFTGVVTGANLVAVGVRMDGHPVVLDGAHALAPLVRRNAAAVGLFMASCAVTVISGDADPALCFATFALLLLGITLINIGARGE